ncbi:MAG: discoidin domain-containing protein, partial [Lachnospiraceae bacterium]|nr:discoidin domain-containing protein [Lachnospiraceae bacterium]
MFQKRFKKAGALALAVCVTLGSIQLPALTAKASDENLALSATATASSTETSDYPASKANDGDGGTRWASARGDRDQTLQLAWDSVQTMKGFVVKWERRNATNYAIETSNDGNSWTEVASFTQKPAETVQKITLDAPVQAQYVRLNIKTFTADGLGGETSWNVVSVYEFEVYEGEIPDNRTEIEKLLDRVTAPQVSEDGTHISMPELGEGVDIRFCADYEQVIGEDGVIYKPLSDKVVKGFYEISVNGEKANSQEYTISVPGRYEPEENANAKPSVIPELQEWHGTQGQFAVSAVSKIVADKELADAAKKFAEDYEIITGSPIQV